MPRTRRYIRALRPFELDIRVRDGLPFACKQLIKLLISSAIARSQRDNKIQICHYIWLGNHLHMLFVPRDAEQCVHFYQELQKKITDAFKRLLGVDRLSLWEGDPVVAEILDLEAAIERVAYYYANPSEADLVETIEEYPGFSSWADFLHAEHIVSAQVTHEVPWIRLPSIPKLESLYLSASQDRTLTANLIERNKKKSHSLTTYPHAWMAAFDISTSSEVKNVRERIFTALRELEDKARSRRTKARKKVLGATKLMNQPIMAPHTPPPRERRVYVLSTVPEQRINHIISMRYYVAKCDNCYQRQRSGETNIEWPPGAIRPSLPPIANALADICSIMDSATPLAA